MSIYWRDGELIVAVYYSSRGYTDAAVAEVLGVRGYRRSAAAVRRKVEGIVRQFPYLLSSSGKWNRSQVDRWLDHLGLAHDVVNSLISCTALDAAIAEKHKLFDQILDTLGQVM